MKEIKFLLNGRETGVAVHPLKRLIDVLREDLSQKGVKEGCGEGECGACSVLKDGMVVNSCIIPAGMIEGCSIETPEGVRETKQGECIVNAFEETGGVQCGFCTPGMVIAAEALLRANPSPSRKEVKEGLSGNLCRCTGYEMIVKGVLLAAERGRGLW